MDQPPRAIDRGLTHIAFVVGDLDASIAFYERYAAMRVVHRREDGTGARVAWVSDGTRPFVLVLIGIPSWVPGRRPMVRLARRFLAVFSHLGVACESRQAVDALCARADAEGVLCRAPSDLGPPVGYFGLLQDPDGNTLEVSFGQEVGVAVTEAGR